MTNSVLEFLILIKDKLEMADAGIPYINQTAYRKKSSCADAIFATQEVIARYVGSAIRMIYRKIQQSTQFFWRDLGINTTTLGGHHTLG